MARTATSHRRPVAMRRHVPVETDRAVAVLDAAPQEVVGSRRDGFWAGAEAHAFLGAQLLPGSLVTRPVRIGFGPMLEEDDAIVLPVWWEDAEHPHLFPTFDGGFELRPEGAGTALQLVGSYEPPLGTVGRFADGLAGHRFVVESLERFLDEVTGRLAEAVVAARPARRQSPR